MSEPRLPRRAQARAASRPDHFAEGAGQLPRPHHVDSRDLKPGEHVRLAIGKEGETDRERLTRGLGASGVVTGHVVKVDKAGVHLRGTGMTWNGVPFMDDPEIDKHPVRWPHHDIGQASRL